MSDVGNIMEFHLHFVKNGVADTCLIDDKEVQVLEYELMCGAALIPPGADVVDSHV